MGMNVKLTTVCMCKRFVEETEEDSCNEESTEFASTTEVGSPKPHNCGDNLQTLLESENHTLSKLLQAMHRTQRVPNDNVAAVLPKFNPDRTGSDGASWCATVQGAGA